MCQGENPMAVTWFPSRETHRLLWLQNFALKLNTYVGTAGIVAGDVTFANGVRDVFEWIINRSDQINTERQEVNEGKRVFADGPIGTPLGAFPAAPAYPPPPLFTPTAGEFAPIVGLAGRG